MISGTPTPESVISDSASSSGTSGTSDTSGTSSPSSSVLSESPPSLRENYLLSEIASTLAMLESAHDTLTQNGHVNFIQDVMAFKKLFSDAITLADLSLITEQVVMDLANLFFKFEGAALLDLAHQGSVRIYGIALQLKLRPWIVKSLELSFARTALRAQNDNMANTILVRTCADLISHLPTDYSDYFFQTLKVSIEVMLAAQYNKKFVDLIDALVVYVNNMQPQNDALDSMMSIVKLLVASNRIVFGASFARSLLKMLSQDPHNAKVHEAIVYIADAYVNLGEYATAYSMYMRLNLVMTGKEKYQALTCILVIKINYCAERLEPEPAKEVTEFQSLSKKEIAQHLGKFKTINEQFHKRNHTVSADILRQCNPHELLQANQVYYSYYGNQAKARGYSTLGMESGNGGFDPYPGLSGAIQDFDHMHSYQYSQPSDKMVETMGSYLRDKKIVRSDIPIRDKNILAGNGTTQLYSIVLAKLLGDRPRTAGKDIILVPSPSYGLFVPQIYALGGEVKTVPLLKSNNYKLTALQLSHAIQATNEELFVKSRIELTSHYNIFLQKAKDLGLDTQRLPIYIGETATTREAIDANLGEITQSTLRLVDDVPVLRAKLSAFGRFSLPLPPEVPRVVGLFFCNIHNPTGKAYNQQEVDSIDQVRRDHHVTVIEDLTHHELKFNKKLQLGYFANRQGIIPYKQATLMGISKNLCAAAWRVGVAYLSDDFNFSAEDASRDDKQRYNYMGITDRLFSQSVFLTPFQRAAILIAFDAKDVARERYVDERNYIYLFRSELFTAFIQGINTITNPVFAIDMINYVKASGSDRALALLISGIPELSIFTVPEGSFFLLIDFSKLINKYVGHLKLETVCEIYQALCSTVNIEAITAEGMLSPDLAIMRFTLGVGRAKIVDCAVRLALFVSLVTAEPTEDLSNVIVVDDKVKQDDLIPQSVNVAPSDAASCASASSSSPSTSDSNSANLLAVVSQVRRQQSIFAQMSAASQPIVEQGASSNQNRTATHLTFWSAPEKKSASVVAVSESAPRPH